METLDNKILKINEYFDRRQNEMMAKISEERHAAIVSETVNDLIERLPSMSMGNIISIFENVSPAVLKTKGGKSKINAFVSIVKEDKNVQNTYLLKENISQASGVDNPKEFINDSIEIVKESGDRKSFNESKSKLVKFVIETIKSVSPEKVFDKIKLDERTSRINDGLEMLAWGKKSIKNVANRANSINEIINFVTKKDSVNENKEEVFERYKEECINTLSEAWENSDSDVRLKLTEMKERISKKSFSELTADDDIKYMKELIGTVK